MKTFVKYLGVVLLLIGVAFLVVYNLALPQNGMLIAAIAFELLGIFTHILINKYLD